MLVFAFINFLTYVTSFVNKKSYHTYSICVHAHFGYIREEKFIKVLAVGFRETRDNLLNDVSAVRVAGKTQNVLLHAASQNFLLFW